MGGRDTGLSAPIDDDPGEGPRLDHGRKEKERDPAARPRELFTKGICIQVSIFVDKATRGWIISLEENHVLYTELSMRPSFVRLSPRDGALSG